MNKKGDKSKNQRFLVCQNRRSRFNKRGLSGVITTLLLILLTLVAVGVIWVVISNIVTEGTEEISLNSFNVKLDIKSVQIEGSELKVNVERNSESANIIGLKFSISNGEDSEVIEVDSDIGPLERRTFTVPYSGIVKEISIAPVFETESGNEKTGSIVDNQKYTDSEMIENLGGVAWWTFDDTWNDQVGSNTCSPQNGATFTSDGRHNQAAYFDGIDDYLDCGNDASLGIGNELTLEVWFKAYGLPGAGGNPQRSLIDKGPETEDYRFFYGGDWTRFYFDAGDGAADTTSLGGRLFNDASDSDIWYHLVTTWDGTNAIFYINAGEDYVEIDPIIWTSAAGSSPLLIGSFLGVNHFWNGTIDEARVYNKALTPEQILHLYNYDFS